MTDSNDQRSDDFERGLANRRAMLGEEWVERSTAGATAFNGEFQEFITRYAWHEIWGRPGLDKTTRRLLVLGMTMGMARWEEFELHCRAAIRGGVPIAKIQETLLQGAIYCGVPAANTAFKIAGSLLQAEGLAPLAQPLTRAARPRVQHTFSQPQLSMVLQGEGRGVPIVLSHGLGLDLRLWDGLAAGLAAEHPTLRYDHRGHGESARPRGPYLLEELADDAARLIREWGRGPVVFVGAGLGGAVGQQLVLRHPELLRGLVRVDAGTQPSGEAEHWWSRCRQAAGSEARADLLLERYLPAAAGPAQREALRALISIPDPDAFLAAGEAEHQAGDLESLKSAPCPVLIVTSPSDEAAKLALTDLKLALAPVQIEVLANVSGLYELSRSVDLCKIIEGFARGSGTDLA